MWYVKLMENQTDVPQTRAFSIACCNTMSTIDDIVTIYTGRSNQAPRDRRTAIVTEISGSGVKSMHTPGDGGRY